MENKKCNLISISGKILSGKDECVKIIQYLTSGAEEKYTYEKYKEIYNKLGEFGYGYLPEWENKKFADKLKDMTCVLLGCNRDTLEDREFKERPLGVEWVVYNYNNKLYDDLDLAFSDFKKFYDNSGRHNIQFEESVKDYINKIELTPRLILQLLGTECGRQILHPNLWVIASFREYDCENDKWLFSDCRFPNELKAIKERGGISIRLNRKKEIVSNIVEHESERALDNATFDYEINNNGTIEELIEQIREILIKENII